MTVQLIMTVVPAKWNEGVLKRYSVGRLKTQRVLHNISGRW